ncbi:hypothetical protein MTR67_050652 [Solanum verrucosum]|uniref:Exocyst complex component SEC5 n=1 Tax=Solanum verrucosum TaxID=315347 RepID=A0AAF0V3D0_SOLVR|nr:hypothetical protein MTR67_050652 [Solanum verrucosum]
MDRVDQLLQEVSTFKGTSPTSDAIMKEVKRRKNEEESRFYKSTKSFLEMTPQSHGKLLKLNNLENIVRLLLELEPESDPVWHYLNIQNLRIRGLLEKCSLDHEARMENLQNEMRAKASYDAKWRQIQQDMNHSSDIDSELLVMTGEQGDAFRGKYIRRLTAVVIHHVPAFWKVSVSVFSGKFAKASQVSSDSNVNASAKRTEEKVGDGKYCSHSLDEVAGMLQSTLLAYGSEVQNTFRDLEESNILCPYMSDAIKEISKACRAFEAKESAPPVAVTALRTLQSEVTKINILRLCSWMRTTTEKITKDETWIPVSILERNRSPYTISSLPLAFRSIITFAMDQINTMIQSLRNEAMKLEDIFLLLQEIQESVRLAFLNCLLNFAGQLGHTGNQLLNEYDRESSHFQNGHAEPEDKSLDPLPGSIVNPHRQLLMVVSNIGFFKDELAHELYSKYRRTWQQSSKLKICHVLSNHHPQFFLGLPLPFLKPVVANLSHLLTGASHLHMSESSQPRFLHLGLHRGHSYLVLNNSIRNLISPSMPTHPYEHPHLRYLHILNMRVLTGNALPHTTMGKDEEDADMQDLIASFSGLEENVLEQYTLAKRNLFRTAAVNYLLESGVQWGAAPAVKGVRDAAVDLLHTLVAVHAEVFAGCKPLLDKTLGILVEGLIDTFLSLFHENQETDFTVLDVNGFCQLMLELDYFETILNTYFTHEARESLKTLQGVLLEKATESVPETVETPSHSRRQTRGNDDALQDERQQGGTISPDDLIALAQQYSSELLQSELERTRINTACFVESISLDSVPDSAKAAYASFRGSMDSPGRGSQSVRPPSYSKQRRR